MSVGAIGAEILGGGGIHPPPWYTSLKHVMALGVNLPILAKPLEASGKAAVIYVYIYMVHKYIFMFMHVSS